MKYAIRTLSLATIIALLTMTGIVAFAPSAQAATASQFQAKRIMDDSVFFNPGTMNTTTIQQFLNAKVPVCDTWHSSTSPGNQPPFTCLKDYRQDVPVRAAESGLCNGMGAGNKSAAQIIFEVSQSCGVSPQVLITLLQKEQSLVTDTWPFTVQYRSATGYGCPDTAACDATYYGFFNQVYAAARQFKNYAKNPANYNYKAGFNNFIRYNPNASCGGSSIVIEGNATAALYNYTPYQPNTAALNNLYGTGDSCSSYGNRNFWRMFTDWFGPTTGTVLLKGSGTTVYLQSSNPGKLYGIPSGEVLRAYNLQNVGVTAVSDSYLASIDTTALLTTLFKKPFDGTIYVADGGTSYGIASGSYCDMWLLPCSNASYVSDLPYSVTLNMPTGPPIGNIMIFDGTLFQLNAGTKRPFVDSADKSVSPWSSEQPITITSPLNAAQPSGAPILYSSKFLKLANNTIYYYNSGKYFTFSSFENFKNWFNGSPVLFDKYSTLNATPPTATTLTDIVTDGTTNSLVNGQTRYVLPASNPPAPISTVTNPELTTLVQSKSAITVDSSKALRLPNGTIAVVQGGSLRPIPTMTDLSLLFTPSNILPVPTAIAQAYTPGKLYIPSGRVFRPTGSPAMYLYGNDNNLWALGSMEELNATLPWAGFNILTTDVSNVQVGSIKVFASLVSISGAYYVVQSNASIRTVPVGVLSTNKDNVSMPLSNPIASKVTVDTKPASFIRFDNGTIFKVSAASIQPLTSLSVYFGLGGNANNTVQLPLKSISAFNIGSPI